MNEELLVGLLAALACGVAALAVPRAIARIPEPEPDPDPEPGPDGDEADREPVPPKTPYAEIAAARGLAVRCALAAAVAGGLLGVALGAVWELLVVLPLVPVGVLLAVVDWRTQLLPKTVVAPTYGLVVVCALAAAALTGEPRPLLHAAIGWAVLGGLYLLLWFIYPPGMGYGDVRLAGVLGIALGFLGYVPFVYGLLLGLFCGGLLGGLLGLLRVVDRKNSPFGPWMLVGAWLGVVVAGFLGVAVS